MKTNHFVIAGCLVTLCLTAVADRGHAQNGKKLQKELETTFRKWTSEDVAYIITDEERAAFKRLSTDDERQAFVENFWRLRDPTPNTEENEYKEEHYRRIAYANEHYASGIPGWRTDRGRIYIVYGAPDEIESHPSGGSYQRPIEEGGGETSTYPFEKWRYRYIEGIGNDVNIEFVDTTMSGEYRMTMDPSEKDALLYVPDAGLSLYEMMRLASKTDRFNRGDDTHLATGNMPLSASMDEFERLRQYVILGRPPAIKFKDLDAVVRSDIRFNTLSMKVRVDYIKITDSTVLTPITIQFEHKDLSFLTKEGVSAATVNIYGRITSMARRVVNVFENPVSIQVAADLLPGVGESSSVYQKSIPLAPGMYRLNVVAKDLVSGNMTNSEAALRVPQFAEDMLSSSSLILADVIEKVPARSIGTGQFVIGDTKVRPRLNATFARNENMCIYAQLYNLSGDKQTHKPNATIEYDIVKDGSSEKVLHYMEDASSLPGASEQQVTVQRVLPLRSLDPGLYTLTLKVTDKDTGQSIMPSASFVVR
jgi:GWxTD domain-containing protein